MNILKSKREGYVAELAKLAISIDADIAEKVAVYKASLEAEGNEKMSKLKSMIDAIDILIANDASNYEIEEAQRVENVAATQLSLDVSEATSVEADASLHSCFVRKTVDQRPGMNSISVPLRQ